MTTTATHPVIEYIANANGFNQPYFDRMFPGIQYSDGVKLCRDSGMNWLIVDILVHLKLTKKLKGQEFISINLKIKEDKSASLVFDDGNGKVLARQRYDYADAPCNMTFYVENGILMLSCER